MTVRLTIGSGRQVIDQAPREIIPIESNGPFTKVQGNIWHSMSVELVYQGLAAHWNISFGEVIFCIKTNFDGIVNALPSIELGQ